MSVNFTLIDDTFSANESSGRKRIFGVLSFTNPYTAAGEVLTAVATFFKAKWLGGRVMSVRQDVPVSLAGLASTGTFRGDANSIASVVVQLFQGGLTTLSGTWVDNTTANISGLTCNVEMNGY